MEEREKEKKIGEEWLKGKEEKKNAKRERERGEEGGTVRRMKRSAKRIIIYLL